MPKSGGLPDGGLILGADVNEYVETLRKSPEFGPQVAFHRVLPEEPPRLFWPNLSEPVRAVLKSNGIERLYGHQATAVTLVRAGCHVAVATPTASGKTLTYNLPMIDIILSDRETAGLYIFPLKALARDQQKAFERLAMACPTPIPRISVYDGDTTPWFRKKIRNDPPHVLITNPELIHLSLLPYHDQWADFFRHLKLVVIDEMHTYRGILGAHMALVLRRLRRICEHYGAAPTFVFSSATVGNPADLAGRLSGLTVVPVTESDAPKGKRHLLLLDPVAGPAQAAIRLLKAALRRGLRTILYTQSRKMTELIALWATDQSGSFRGRISAYRSGFLPEERREIESKLASGELLAVVSTSALELGIDIGDLDLCILVGYPGTLVATWQRGGRVGRGGQDAALVLIAGDDALDRYFLRHPDRLISQPPEAAVINPENQDILTRHLPCAAAELPLSVGEPLLASAPAGRALQALEKAGDLLRDAGGNRLFSRSKYPHRQVDLRGTGNRFRILSRETGDRIGEIDGFRAFRETHPGAVYLHRGKTYRVETLDPETGIVSAVPETVDYYTRVQGHKETEILETYTENRIFGTQVAFGRLKVTDRVTGFERLSVRGNRLLGRSPLTLPPQIFETEGLWVVIPESIQMETEVRQHHFMGGIHAVEHAAIGIFPLLILADRNDLGGISTPFHPQVGTAAIFIYDGIPGGIGLSREAFGKASELLLNTLQAIRDCPCATGCPACVHSPKCGSGNRPIDKAAAIFLLEKLLRQETGAVQSGKISTESDPISLRNRFPARLRKPRFRIKPAPFPGKPASLHYGVFDLETQLSAQEVGGWHRADRMRISCAVLYDSKADHFYEYTEGEVGRFIAHLARFELVVGFNIQRFDYRVLSGYTDTDFSGFPTLDLLSDIHEQLGYRLSLDHLARVTLGVQKTADGLQALAWWKEGRLRDIIDYCRKDVEITRDIYLYGKKNGYLLFNSKAGATVRVPVRW